MNPARPFQVAFFRSESGTEPVRDWLQGLRRDERKVIGEDIKRLQYGWPVGMPLVRKVDAELWEIRSDLHGRISRILLTVHGDTIVLLHGFIKKSQKIPANDLKAAKARLAKLKGIL